MESTSSIHTRAVVSASLGLEGGEYPSRKKLRLQRDPDGMNVNAMLTGEVSRGGK